MGGRDQAKKKSFKVSLGEAPAKRFVVSETVVKRKKKLQKKKLEGIWIFWTVTSGKGKANLGGEK